VILDKIIRVERCLVDVLSTKTHFTTPLIALSPWAAPN